MDFARGCFFMAGMAVAATGTVDIAKAAPINTVTRLAGPVSGDLGSPIDLLFDPIADAFDLVSISAGSVSTAEGGGFRISVIYVDNTTASVADFTLSHTGSKSFSSIPDATFASFTMGDVKGLRFSHLVGTGQGGSFLSLNVPSSTAVTFAAIVPAPVPLPASLALLPLGVLALGAVRRRRRQSVPDAGTAPRA
jgi:hypothetical protein